MINIHVLGNGSSVYAVKSLLEVNSLTFNDDITVTCFGDHYLNSVFVRPINHYPDISDIIKSADIVVCTEPDYEFDNIVNICNDYSVPLLCSFELTEKIPFTNGIRIDNLNVMHAATNMWINRLLNVVENLTEIKHYVGLSKLHDTGDNALPGITVEEYLKATENITQQPQLIKLENNYYYSSEIEVVNNSDVVIEKNWIIDSNTLDTLKIDLQSEFIFHTTYLTKRSLDDQTHVHHSHMKCPNSRSLAAWHYINACVVCSFVYMWNHNQLPTNCNDYNMIDHSTFSDNIFGARFRIA